MPKVKRSKRSRGVEEEVFSVETIIDKKITDGKVYYYLKWFGYEDSDNTWEPVDNLSCPALIEEFERQWAETHATGSSDSSSGAKKSNSRKAPTSSKSKSKGHKIALGTSKVISPTQLNGDDDQTDERIVPQQVSGFAKGWDAEDILGATEENGQILFLIKWYDGIYICNLYWIFIYSQFTSHIPIYKSSLIYLISISIISIFITGSKPRHPS